MLSIFLYTGKQNKVFENRKLHCLEIIIFVTFSAGLGKIIFILSFLFTQSDKDSKDVFALHSDVLLCIAFTCENCSNLLNCMNRTTRNLLNKLFSLL